MSGEKHDAFGGKATHFGPRSQSEGGWLYNFRAKDQAEARAGCPMRNSVRLALVYVMAPRFKYEGASGDIHENKGREIQVSGVCLLGPSAREAPRN